MPSQPVFFDLADTADERFDPVIEALLVGLLAFAPLAFGSVHPWSELIVIVLAFLALIVLALKLLLRPDVRFVWTSAYVPVLAFIALALLQLVPLPARVLHGISPETLDLRSEILASIAAGLRHLDRLPLSFYPEATLDNLRMLLAVCAVLVVGVNVVRRLRQVKRILGAIAIVGAILAAIALAQVVTEASRIYWLIPIPSNQANSGPFVNHNHFAQFMSLSMGAALALMLMHLDEMPRHRMHDETSVAAAALARPVTRAFWMLACAVVLMAVAVVLSLSRGGMISMVIAGGLTAVVLATRGMRGRTWIFIGIVMAVTAVVVLVQFEPVLSRATKIDDPQTIRRRLDVLHATGQIARQFPLFGTGLGTFRWIFPPFDPGLGVLVVQHAENEYAQVLIETGAVGLLIVALFILLIAGAYLRCLRGAPSPMASAAIGLGFGFIAILVHSTADFAQHVPAIAMLTSVTCALLINLAHATRRGRGRAVGGEIVPRARLWPKLALAGAVTGVAVVVCWGAADVWRAQVEMTRATSVALGPAERAVQRRPSDVQLRYRLNLRRIEAAHPPQDVANDLLAHAWQGPLFMPQYLVAGQLTQDEQLIRTAWRLAPNHPDACIAAAIADARDGRWEDALEKLERAIVLRDDYRREVIDVLVDRLGRADLAMQLAREDLDSMRYLRSLLRERGDRMMELLVKRQGEELMLRRAADPRAPPALLAEAAELCRAQGQLEAAVRFYRRALAVEFNQTRWRMALARLLHEVGKEEEAQLEARAALRYAPADPEASAFLQLASPPRPATAPATVPATGPARTTAPAFKLD
jgi:O-antigen ligase/tetratricopeptide (TPR) repeat protein